MLKSKAVQHHLSHLPLPAPSQTTYHLPDLHDIIFWYRTNYPGFVWIPGEIGYLRSMTTMNKLVLGEKKKKRGKVFKSTSQKWVTDQKSRWDSNDLPTALGDHPQHLQGIALLQFYCKKREEKGKGGHLFVKVWCNSSLIFCQDNVTNLGFTSSPKHLACGQCHWRPIWFHYGETTEPTAKDEFRKGVSFKL